MDSYNARRLIELEAEMEGATERLMEITADRERWCGVAGDLAEAALDVCEGCKAGRPRADIHSGVPTDYHGYAYSPCKIPPSLRKALDAYARARGE